jgi:hypothetical protein
MAKRRMVTKSIFDGKKRVNTFFVRSRKKKKEPSKWENVASAANS